MRGNVKRDPAAPQPCLSLQLNNWRVHTAACLAHMPLDMRNNPLHNEHIITVLVLKVRINPVPLPPAAAPPITGL